MRWILNVVAIVLLLIGTVWILQGLDILTQGFMAGHIQYTIVGAIVDVIAIALIVTANRRRNPGSSGPTSAAK